MYFSEAKSYISNIRGAELKKIEFLRGLGVIESRLILYFISEKGEFDFEVESNFRIRTPSNHILSYNDLYIDLKRKSMSVRKYRSQINIEKSYLNNQIIYVNSLLSNNKVTEVIIKEYGDIYFSLDNNLVIEVFADTHLENAVLYRIIKNKDALEFSIENNIIIAKVEKYS